MSIISESVLKTLAIAGLVGAGTIAINETAGAIKKKNLEKAEEEIIDEEEELAEDVESVQECKETPKTVITVDSEKLKNILVAASYPAEAADAFVAQIAKDAKPEESTVTVEVLKKDDEPKAPTFTVVKEEKKQPDLKAKPATKKSNKKEDK